MLNYCHNPTNDVPIILVDKHIGLSDTKGEGIMANKFTSDLLTLKNMGKKAVEVWINSTGGNVLEGMQMYNAIKSSGMYVTTRNVGGAMSVASWLLQAGDKRVATSNSFAFVHNVTPDNEHKDFNALINNAIISRSKLSTEEMAKMMEEETLIPANKLHEYGLIDELVNYVPFFDADKAMNDGANYIKNTFDMSKVNQILGLSNDASIDSQAEAISKIVEAKNAADAKAADLATKIAEIEAAKNSIAEQLEKANSTIAAANAEKATNLIKEHQGKRLPKEDADCAKWVELAKNDYEGTKSMIEALPLNVTATTIPAGSDKQGARKFDPATMEPQNSYEHGLALEYRKAKQNQ